MKTIQNEVQQTPATTCPICGKQRAFSEMQSGLSLPDAVQHHVHEQHPDWEDDMAICDHCIRNANADLVEEMLEAEHGTLSELDREVIDSFRDGDMMPMNTNEEDQRERTYSEIYADKLADVVGSWRFSVAILTFLIIWCGFSLLSGIMQNNIMLMLGVISATLGSLAAIQGPIILMSQRRAAKRDRIRAENDYRVNLKAELEINAVNQKLDHIIKLQLDNIRRIEELEQETEAHKHHLS